ncbi:MAG: peptidyl-prolyl cis-trans isomerase [Candidatus Omnitrophica bacterium]|nr:peptidyl-prolyl cis-trans isomerase [Candidatus Omnitrophota bacterium]
MKKMILALVFLSTLCILRPGACLYAQDKIIAIVNNDIITQKDLNDFMHFMRMQLSQENSGQQLEEKIRAMLPDLRNKLIEDRLILQEAKKSEIKVEQARIEGRLKEIKGRYSSEAEFQKAIAAQGLVQADIEARIREQLLMYYLIEQKVRSKIIVRPEEVTAFYDTHKDKFMSPREFQLEVVTLEDEGSARAFFNELKKGQGIEELASKYSVQPNRLDVSEDEELRKEISRTVFGLKVAGVSAPVRIDGKYYIFRLDNISASVQLTLFEVQDKINDLLTEAKFQEELKKWLDTLKNESYIKIIQD